MKQRTPEPWMFGTSVTVDGQPVQAQIGRFTILGQLRMKLRQLRGKPAYLGTRDSA